MNDTTGYPFPQMCQSILSVLFAAVVTCIIAGCHKAEETETLRPEFETAPIQLSEGETRQIRILNADYVQITSHPPCITVEPDGTTLEITGLSMGEGQLVVNADKHRLQCTVKVVKHGLGTEFPQEPAEETAAQLQDASLRISLGKREMRYSVAGTIFTLSRDKCSIKAASLNTGEEMQLIFNAPIQTNPSKARFILNGIELETSSVEQMRCDRQGVWLRVTAPANGYIWAVVPTDF